MSSANLVRGSSAGATNMPEAAQRIDLVMTVTLQDYDRSNILRRSLDRFFRAPGTRWVVTPAPDLDQISAHLTAKGYRVISEDSVIPELKFYNRLRVVFGRTHAPTLGWFVAQLIRLAMAERIETEFYLTLDSDVVCTKPVRYDDLIKNGRAIPRAEERGGVNPYVEWDEWAERVLGLPRLSVNRGVTPHLFNRTAVLALQRHLAGRVPPVLRSLGAVLPERSRARNVLASWRSYLLRNLPWIDSVLYDTFLEGTGQFQKYHLLSGEPAIAGNSVWYKETWTRWKPEDSFTNRNDFFFSVLQSNAGMTVEEVWERIRPFLDPDDAAAGQLSSASTNARNP